MNRETPKIVLRLFSMLGCLALVPTFTFAQSGIAGVVKDASGGVLPGVTVEASSPVLIEKVRSVTTNGEGLYSVVDLRPGTYMVTFSLPGFSTVRREGIELPAAFTATVNADLRVGTLEETVIVSGEAPLVDVQSVAKQEAFSKDLLDALPTGRTPQSIPQLVPGVVGGLNTSGVASRTLAYHGSRGGEALTATEGFADVQIRGTGGGSGTFYLNPLNIQELNVQLGGNSAEMQTSGIFTNIIPREGGNLYSGSTFVRFSGERFEADNLTAAHLARGLTSVNGLKQERDVSQAFGGPLKRDKLWFFTSVRDAVLIRYIAGLYYNKDPKGWVYVQDLTRPAIIKETDKSVHLRLTWQISPRNRLSVSEEIQPHVVFQRSYSSTRSPEATGYTPYIPNNVVQILWKSTVSNRMLLEAGSSYNANNFNGRVQNEKGGLLPGEGDDIVTLQKTESRTGLIYGSGGDIGHHISRGVTSRASMTYVTGSHTFKTGFNVRQGYLIDKQEINGDVQISLLDGVPRSLTLNATPYTHRKDMKADLGVYAQDRWTYKRLTANVGLRYDYYNGTAREADLPATRFVPERHFDAVYNVPNWKDVSPRLGVSYDLFGDGKTAIKGGIYKFVAGEGAAGISQQTHPVVTSVLTTTRNWDDANKNFVIDCDLTNPLANGVGDTCGQINNFNFGKVNPSATRFDPEVLRGWGKRGYNWESSAEIQHQVLTGVSVTAGYYRRSYGNHTLTDNVLRGTADFDQFCVTAPVSPDLPGGGGNEVCGYYNVSLAKSSSVENVVTFAKNFGDRQEIYDGADFSASARLPRGVQISGGVSLGRTTNNTCYVVDSPQELLWCDQKPPYQPNVKVFGVYPLPWWGLQTSASYYGLPGPEITATRTYTNAEILPSLKRNLSSGPTGTVALNIIEPSTVYAKRVNQVDFRASKNIRYNRARILASLDVFNVFNSSDVQTHTTTFGPAFLRPTQVLNGRNFKFNLQLDF